MYKNSTIMKTIRTIIGLKENDVFRFKPTPSFYREIGINQKRWGQIYRGEIEPVVSELKRIAEYFEVDVTELINQNQ